MDTPEILKMVSQNGFAVVLCVLLLWRADKYISLFIPKLDSIEDKIVKLTDAFYGLSRDIEKLLEQLK